MHAHDEWWPFEAREVEPGENAASSALMGSRVLKLIKLKWPTSAADRRLRQALRQMTR